MNTQEIIDIETKNSAGTYAKQPLVIVRGLGASLFDVDGVEYLDCSSGHGVANLGHANPKVAEAIYKQASTLITLFETFPNDKRAELMKKLTSLIDGLDRVFLCNSGTESVEAAFKFARISTGRKNIVAAMRAFHGRTYGSLSATYNKKYREGFEPLVPGFSHVAYNKGSALAEIARRMEVTCESIIAAGDHLNDLPMLLRQRAQWLIAPGNAIPQVKEAVLRQKGFVAEAFHGHGVASGLERIIESLQASVSSRDEASASA
jgi:acetylornithine/succinyldiaminopimelate/putrescine aminotransferase